MQQEQKEKSTFVTTSVLQKKEYTQRINRVSVLTSATTGQETWASSIWAEAMNQEVGELLKYLKVKEVLDKTSQYTLMNRNINAPSIKAVIVSIEQLIT